MKPQYHNPEQVTQEQLQPEQGWRFLLEGEAPHIGDEAIATTGQWFDMSVNNKYVSKWSIRTKRPLPIAYCQGEAAEAFDDPAYRRSVRYYANEQEMRVEYLQNGVKGDEWDYSPYPYWQWQDFSYRLAADQPCAHERVTVTADGGRCNACKADLDYNEQARNWKASEPPSRAAEKRMTCGGMSIKKMIRLLKAAKKGAQIQRKARLFQIICPLESVWHDVNIEEAGFSVPTYDYRVKTTVTPIESAISRFTGKPFVEEEAA